MSLPQQIEQVREVVHSVKEDFSKLAEIHGAVHFDREASFALQILKENDYLARTAMGNVDSLKRAVLNVAAVGLTLNPVHKLAYLLPRKGKVCLDVSYRGLIYLATDVGGIKWAHAEIVKEHDEFVLQSIGTAPVHKFSPFKDRGQIVGAYCVAKTHDGEFLVTVMSFDEIKSIRNRSESWKAYEKDNQKLNPWVTDESEMIKKTVIKRAYKTWPMVNTRRVDDAVSLSNEVDPIDLLPQIAPTQDPAKNERVDQIREMIRVLGKEESAFIVHSSRTFKRKIEKLEDLTDSEIKRSIAMLNTMIDETLKEKNT